MRTYALQNDLNRIANNEVAHVYKNNNKQVVIEFGTGFKIKRISYKVTLTNDCKVDNVLKIKSTFKRVKVAGFAGLEEINSEQELIDYNELKVSYKNTVEFYISNRHKY